MAEYVLKNPHTKEYVKIINRLNNTVFGYTNRKAEAICRPAEVMDDWLKKLGGNLELIRK